MIRVSKKEGKVCAQMRTTLQNDEAMITLFYKQLCHVFVRFTLPLCPRLLLCKFSLSRPAVPRGLSVKTAHENSMAKKTKQKAWKLEVEAIDRQLNEIREKRKELLNRKRELIEQNTKRRTPTWDEHTPMVKLVRTGMRKEFKQMLDVWQRSSEAEIDYRTTAKFDFIKVGKPGVIRALSKALHQKIFNSSNNEVFRYISEHSNLGEWKTLKREELRYRDKSGDKK